MSRIVSPSSPGRPLDLGPHDGPDLRVEPRRRLVEEEHARAVHEAHGDVEPPLHAARVGAGQPVGRIGEAEALEQRRPRARLELARRAARGSGPGARGSRARSPRGRRLSAARRRRSRDARGRAPAARRCRRPTPRRASGRESVVRILTAVDFPAPFGPSRAKIDAGLDRERDAVESPHARPGSVLTRSYAVIVMCSCRPSVVW